jgi:hypothetical protein
VLTMVLHALTGMLTNHGAKMQMMNFVNLFIHGAMSILLVMTLKRLITLKGLSMQVSSTRDSAHWRTRNMIVS